VTSAEGEKLAEKITQQGDKVRELKANKSVSKEEVTAAVEVLKTLKEQYKTLTGTDAPSSGAAPARKEKEKKPAVIKTDHEQASGASHADLKKQTK